MGHLRHSHEGRPVARLGGKGGANQLVGDPKVPVGLVALPQVGGDRHSLNTRHAHIRGPEFQRQGRISPYIVGEPAKILERGVDDHLPGLAAAGQIPHFGVDVEELVRQLAHLRKALLGNRALTVDGV